MKRLITVKVRSVGCFSGSVSPIAFKGERERMIFADFLKCLMHFKETHNKSNVVSLFDVMVSMNTRVKRHVWFAFCILWEGKLDLSIWPYFILFREKKMQIFQMFQTGKITSSKRPLSKYRRNLISYQFGYFPKQ